MELDSNTVEGTLQSDGTIARSPKLQAMLDRSRHQVEETGGIPHDEFWREVRAERRPPVAKIAPKRPRAGR